MNLPTLISRVAFGATPDVALPSYTDVSDCALEFHCRRGRANERAQTDVGTASVVYSNRDRRFDPTFAGSPFSPNVVPMVKMQHAANWSGTEYKLHTGHVENWPLQWESPTWQRTAPSVSDAFAALQIAQVTGSFPQQTTGARVAAVLAAISWPTSAGSAGTGWTLDTSALGTTTLLAPSVPLTNIATGLSVMQAVDVVDSQPRSALDLIQEASAAEPGMFYIAGDGTAVFEDRQARYTRTVAATFSDNPSGSDIQYEDMTPDYDIARVINDVVATTTIGGTPTTALASDSVSVNRFFRRSATINVPLTTLAALQDRANFELTQYAYPFVRFDRMVVRPAGQPTAWPTLLGLELGSKVTITRTPAQGTTIVRTCFVESVEHAVTRDDWTVTMQLSPGEAYTNAWVLDTSALDVNTTLVY
jgi:hypothetical protein